MLALRSQQQAEQDSVSPPDLLDSPATLPQKQQRRPGPDKPRRGIPPEQWPDVLKRVEQGDTLRQIAQDYGVSYETVRRTVIAARKRQQGGEQA